MDDDRLQACTSALGQNAPPDYWELAAIEAAGVTEHSPRSAELDSMPLHRSQPEHTFKPGAVKLYLDDLHAMEDILLKVSDSVTVKVSGPSGEYSADSVADLKDAGEQRFRSLKMASGPYGSGPISVNVDPYFSETTAQGDDAAIVGAFTMICGILKARRRWVLWPAAKSLPVAVVLYATLWLSSYNIDLPAVVGYPLFGALVLWAGAGFYSLFFGKLILPYTRASRPPFLRRNKDSLAVGGIMLLLGAVLSYVATRLAGG